MVLPPLATPADLALAGGTGTTEEMTLALRRASARVRHYTRQEFTFGAGDTVELTGGEKVLRLPQYPAVVDGTNPLTVVERAGFGGLDQELMEGRDFERLGNELTRGHPYWDNGRTMGWPWRRPYGVWAPTVQVTYSHGYTQVPEDVVDIVLDLAVMNLTNPGLLRTVAIDDFSKTYASETIGGARLSKSHQAELRSYRRGSFSVRQS